MPHQTARRHKTTDAPIYMNALSLVPVRHSSKVSSPNAEKVVNPPQTPGNQNSRQGKPFCSGGTHAVSIPISAHPATFTANVPQGKLPPAARISQPAKAKRSIPPIAEPHATAK